MIVTYRFRVTAVCPVDGTRDVYEATHERRAPLLVEELSAIIDGYVHERVLQEDLTSQLAKQLGGTVETTGWHSGVQVTCRV